MHLIYPNHYTQNGQNSGFYSFFTYFVFSRFPSVSTTAHTLKHNWNVFIKSEPSQNIQLIHGYRYMFYLVHDINIMLIYQILIYYLLRYCSTTAKVSGYLAIKFNFFIHVIVTVLNIIIYLDEFPYTLPLEATVQVILELHLSVELHDCRPSKGPPYTMTPTNDGWVRQRLLIRCYSYGRGYVNNQTAFGRDQLSKYRLFGFYRA